MAISKIALNTENGEQVLVDLTGDTVVDNSLVTGYTAHGADGEIVVGANPYELEATNTEVGTQTDLIAQIQTALEGKAAGGSGGSGKPEQEKSVSITENGEHTVAPDDGYTMSKVTVNVNVPDVPAVVDVLEVTENGAYNAADEDLDGFSVVTVNVPDVPAVVEELNVTENGTYEPDDGVDGFSKVTVNVPTGGGGDEADILDGILTRNGPTEITNSRITSLGINALNGCSNLVRASFPNVTSCNTSAFQNCSALEQVDLPKVNNITTNTFRSCSSLQSFVCKNPLTMRAAFYGCSSLALVDISITRSVEANTFYGCKALVTLILRNTTFYTLANVNAFTGTPIEAGTGYIYVPRALVDTYKAATNWSTFAAQFRAIEDYPDITGG